MNYHYSHFHNQSEFTLTDFNCVSFDKRLGDSNYYKIIWVKDQDILIEVDGYHLTIKKNHVLFCTPLNILKLDPYTEGVVSYIFNREFYCTRDHDNEVSCQGFLFYGSSLPPIVELNKKEQGSFELLFMMFQEEFSNKDHIQGEMLRVLLKRLLIKSVRLAKEIGPYPEMQQSKFDEFRKFNLLVEEHFRSKHKVADYAALLNKTPKSLSNLFLKYNQKSPHKVISERVSLEAQRLLNYSKKKVFDISNELGFSEVSHFSKYFKKHTGLSPNAFRNQT
ncbi:MAG: AraC family transcriptional regulator [Psychroserpens sp.]|uniref:helix-turn-helix domain-containing protein n=1 Tax=Psychroserpens sp. TaxID=2020870 RepID=UPI00300222F4